MSRLLGTLTPFAAILACLVPGAAAAGYPVDQKYPVASGTSPEGVPWHIDAERWHQFGYFDFYYDPPGHSDAGWGAAFSLPVPPAFLASVPGDFTPIPEADLSGAVGKPIRGLTAKMSDGTALPIPLYKAPEEVRADHPWLRSFAVFDVFFSPDIEPKLLRAYDADHQLIDRFHCGGRSFYC